MRDPDSRVAALEQATREPGPIEVLAEHLWDLHVARDTVRVQVGED